MNSKTVTMVDQEQESRNIVHKISVRVPPMLPSSSSSSLSLSSSSNKQFNCASQCCLTQFLIRNRSNFKRSGPPARLMYYQDGSWVDFSSKVFGDLKLGFLEGNPVIEIGIEGVQYLVDFYRMLQIDLGTGAQRSIAWIDVGDECFFPQTFIDGGEDFAEASGNPKIEIEIRIGEDLNLSKRKRESLDFEEREDKAEGSCSNFQPDGLKKQRLVTSNLEPTKWPKTKLLKEGEKCYSIVKNLFVSGLANIEPSARITAIHQCTRTGPLDRARSEVFQKQVEITKAARGESNMIFAWHGTSAKGVASILNHGFSMPSKVSDSEAHGVGVYLSPVRSPHISAMSSEVDDEGEKHVILCRVILGKCEKIEAGSKQLYPSAVDFDTGVDDLNNPKWYVVWTANMNSHILPECVVSYKSSDSLPGQPRGSPFMKLIPNAVIGKLFSKLCNSQPSSKLQELQNLCSRFKDGKMGKDIFMKQLRSIAGDEMLLSTIREVRG